MIWSPPTRIGHVDTDENLVQSIKLYKVRRFH